VIATLRGWVEGRVELIEVYAAAAAGDAAAMYGAHYKVAFGVSCGAACTVALAGGDICIGLGAASDASDAVAQVACAAADATDNTDAATEARQATFRQCADMIRGRIPWSLVRDSLIKCGVEAKDLECAGEATEVAS
jgi:phage-related tail protein